MSKEDIRQSFYRNDNLTLWFEEQKIVDSPDRVFACYNACRGLNPEHVPELVAMVEKLQLALGIFLTGDQQPSAYIKQKTLDVYQEGLELLAKVKQ